MSEDRDQFERELARRLREWTDPAVKEQEWGSAARHVLDTAADGWWRPWRRPFAVAASIGAIVLVVAWGAIVINQPPVASSTPTPEPSPSGSATATQFPATTPMPSATPIPSVVPADALDLADAAWWDLESIGFGIVPELSPQPSPVVQPAGFKLLRVGTLDGRVTTMLALHWAWGHSYVSLPVAGRVLVANDFGDASSIRSVDARTGTIHELFVTPEIVTAAAPIPGTNGAYVYALADRSSGADLGVWLHDPDGGEPRLVDSGPAGFGIGDVNIWQLAVSPDGHTLVSQYCAGSVRCETHISDISTGDTTQTTSIGWVQGFLGERALARRIGSVDLVAMDLATTTLEDAAAFDPGGVADRPLEHATELPYGWRADWPELRGQLLVNGPDPAAVRLVNGLSGEELITPELVLAWPSSCTPIRPRELPSGQAPGSSVPTLENGVRMATFGQGADLVVEAMGPLPAPTLPDAAAPVIIRGVAGASFDLPFLRMPTGDSLTHPAIQWEEGGCWYRVILASGGDPSGYASRF